MQPYRDYRPHLEHGCIVWYKSKAFRVSGKNKDGEPVTKPTNIDRVVTNTSDYSEACKMLDNYLKPKAKEVKMDTSGNLKLF